jgi:[acyl-carrier-protein] S-malonyltransferase
MSTSLAFVFPGQGSLSMGTLADFGAENPVILETFKEASKALGYNLWALVQEGPQEQLDQPEKAEPAILTVSIALWRLWLENGGPCPAFVSGHGFGEYSALVAAGSLSLDTAVRLIESRARLMQATAELNDGAMVTILGLEDADVVAICGEAAKGQVVSVTYFNSPGQVVIAGHKAAVNRATELCKAKGAKRVVPTAGNVPSHCALMKPAAGRFSAMVNSVEWMTPHMPVVRNVTATVAADLDTLKQDLMVELYKPVHWVECVRTLARNGVVSMVECGPGRALAALNKRCADGVTTYGINSPDQLATTRAALS